MLIALTRAVPPSIARCELTHLARTPIDLDLAVVQHAAYERALAEAGCQLRRVPAEPDLPDSVFVEDTAVVLDEVAVITRPGAASRRGETPSVRAALSPHRPLLEILEPGTLDGGDVLRIGRRILVGRSGRSNDEGIRQMRALLRPFGYSVEGVEVAGCLHLKSAVTAVGADSVLLNPRWVDPDTFRPMKVVEVDPGEPMAANALLVNGRLLYPAEFPRTAARLREAGVDVVLVEAGELARAEGALTCCSLIFET